MSATARPRGRPSASRSSRAAPAWRSRRSPTSDPAVRDAAPEDARAILRVRTRSWQVAYAHAFPRESLEAMPGEEWEERWREGIANPRPHMHMLVVDREGEVAGFAHVGHAREDPELGELYAIYVLPDAWGYGIGQALMAEALNRLSREGFREAILWVLEDNPRTRRFYELAGWTLDGGTKDEEWLGTLVRELRYRIALT